MTTSGEPSAFENARDTWEAIGEADPFWGVDTSRRFNDSGGKDLFFQQGQVEVEQILDLAVSLNPDLRFRSALDFGCGVGRLTHALARRFERVTGVDVSRAMIAEAERYRYRFEEKDSGQISFSFNPKTDLSPFKDQSFDFVLSLITLQHLRPSLIERYIEELCRVTARNGVLVFQVPAKRDSLVKRLLAGIPRYLGRIRVKESRDLLNRMEMHGLPQSQVRKLVNQSGRNYAFALRDTRAASWKSFTYFISQTT